jgi:hypothetical protein
MSARGGTDGSRLSFMGRSLSEYFSQAKWLFHGKHEYVSVQDYAEIGRIHRSSQFVVGRNAVQSRHMNLRLYFTVILAGALSHAGQCQSLVVNGGFEDVNSCTEFQQPCAPEGWFIPLSEALATTRIRICIQGHITVSVIRRIPKRRRANYSVLLLPTRMPTHQGQIV